MRGPHDVGGLPDGPVETTAHDPTLWEKQIDALRYLVGGKGIFSTDENRRYVESLGHDAYEQLSYYERWTASLDARADRQGDHHPGRGRRARQGSPLAAGGNRRAGDHL